MRKINKTICLDEDAFNFLSEQENASYYVQCLIYREMKQDIERNKKPQQTLDMSSIHTSAVEDLKELAKKEEDKKARAAAWDLLDVEVREEIKDMESWGVKWHTIFYPMYAAKGSLTLKDVRDWYFANKEGFKL